MQMDELCPGQRACSTRAAGAALFLIDTLFVSASPNPSGLFNETTNMIRPSQFRKETKARGLPFSAPVSDETTDPRVGFPCPLCFEDSAQKAAFRQKKKKMPQSESMPK